MKNSKGRWAILVSGSHRRTPGTLIAQRAKLYYEMPLIIHGQATGVDGEWERIAGLCDWPTLPMPAQWSAGGSYNVKAGPIRNGHMAQVWAALGWCGYQLAFEAFPATDSKGTRDMINKVTRLIHKHPELVSSFCVTEIDAQPKLWHGDPV